MLNKLRYFAILRKSRRSGGSRLCIRFGTLIERLAEWIFVTFGFTLRDRNRINLRRLRRVLGWPDCLNSRFASVTVLVPRHFIRLLRLFRFFRINSCVRLTTWCRFGVPLCNGRPISTLRRWIITAFATIGKTTGHVVLEFGTIFETKRIIAGYCRWLRGTGTVAATARVCRRSVTYRF